MSAWYTPRRAPRLHRLQNSRVRRRRCCVIQVVYVSGAARLSKIFVKIWPVTREVLRVIQRDVSQFPELRQPKANPYLPCRASYLFQLPWRIASQEVRLNFRIYGVTNQLHSAERVFEEPVVVEVVASSFLWKPKVHWVHCCVRKNLPLDPILNQNNPVHALHNLFKNPLILFSHVRLDLQSGLFPNFATLYLPQCYFSHLSRCP